MKKNLSILSLLLMVSSVVFAHRAVDPSARMAVLKYGSTFKLLYKGARNADVRVLILNDNGQIIFSERIKNVDGFVRPYNFSSLPEGNYSIELTDADGRQRERISHYERNKDKLASLVRLAGADKKFVLSVPNQGTDNITITIYDESSAVLYSETEEITGNFAKVYNLNQLEGSVRFNVTDSKGNTKSFSGENL
jgi:hypothetical protein